MFNINKCTTGLATILLCSALAAPAIAEENGSLLDKSKFSLGAGIANNSVSGFSDEIGFQFFGAYDLTQVKLVDGVDSSVEFGVTDYGFPANSTGIWVNYVVDGTISGDFGWLARLGFDLGDDSGLMVGAGAGYAVNKQVDLRLEYVIRDEVNELQFNFKYHL